MVEYGQSVTLLKYMVKCALMNNEIALARSIITHSCKHFSTENGLGRIKIY